ncbi:MAG: hypothetical protein M5U28_32300 [Sandaracinaceae bacterium]|nr:hypothetical protein [Sandaracinaceae bacterium]
MKFRTRRSTAAHAGRSVGEASRYCCWSVKLNGIHTRKAWVSMNP